MQMSYFDILDLPIDTVCRHSVSMNDLNCESETVICGRQSPPFPLAEKETGNKPYDQSA
jgi:hypothetical protein